MIEFLFGLFGWTTTYHISFVQIEGQKITYQDCVIAETPWLTEESHSDLCESLQSFYGLSSKPTILSIYKL